MSREGAAPKVEVGDLSALVIETIASVLELKSEELTRSTRLAEINMDSLSLLTVTSQIGAAYGVEFEDRGTFDLISADRISDLVEVLARKLESSHPISLGE